MKKKIHDDLQRSVTVGNSTVWDLIFAVNHRLKLGQMKTKTALKIAYHGTAVLVF